MQAIPRSLFTRIFAFPLTHPAFVLALAGLAACSDDGGLGTGPGSAAAGVYDRQTVDGRPAPFGVAQSMGFYTEFVAQVLELRLGGTCVAEDQIRETAYDPITGAIFFEQYSTRSAGGSWSFSGNLVTINWDQGCIDSFTLGADSGRLSGEHCGGTLYVNARR